MLAPPAVPMPAMDLEDRIRGYTCHVVGCVPDRVTEVIRFEAGNRHSVYRVSCLDEADTTTHLVVRVTYGGDPDECAAAEREARVLAEVGATAGPLLHDFRRTSPWFDTPAMLMQFLPGPPRDLASIPLPEIERLGTVLAWVHGRSIDDLAPWLGPVESISASTQGRLQSILSGMAWVRDPLTGPIQAALRGAAQWVEESWEVWRETESFRTEEPLALLHGDPGPGNILWGPDPMLIDWEYTRLGDPADEIAYLFDQNGLGAPQREAFWQGYGRNTDRRPQLTAVTARAEWWEPVTLLGSTLWWVERWVRRVDAEATGREDRVTPREPDYYLDQATRRLGRLESLLARR